MRDHHSTFPPPDLHARRLSGRDVLGWAVIVLCAVGMVAFFVVLPVGI